MSERKVPIEELTLDARCQARADVSHDAIEEYAEAYRAKAKLPPPDAFEVDGALIVVDGYHRVPAAIAAGVSFLRVRIVGSGSFDEAVWYATGVNQAHGVRRSHADKRRAVRMAIESPIGQEQSTRAIADHLGVSADFVSRLRREWEAAQVSLDDTSPPGATAQVSSNDTCPPPRRTGKDGKSYPAKRPQVEDSSTCPPIGGQADSAPPPFDPGPATAEPMPQYNRTLRLIRDAIARTRREAMEALPAELVSERQRIEAALRQAEAVLKFSELVVCERCNGPGCKHCSARGWLARGTSEARR